MTGSGARLGRGRPNQHPIAIAKVSLVPDTPSLLARPNTTTPNVTTTVKWFDNSPLTQATYDFRGSQFQGYFFADAVFGYASFSNGAGGTNATAHQLNFIPIEVGKTTPATQIACIGGVATGDQARTLSWEDMKHGSPVEDAIDGGMDPNTAYSTYIPGNNNQDGDGLRVHVAQGSWAVIDGFRCDSTHDGIGIYSQNDAITDTGDVYLRNCWMNFGHDDAIENDRAYLTLHVDDCLFEQIHGFLSYRANVTTGSPDPLKTATIRDSIIWQYPKPGPSQQPRSVLGSGNFFKSQANSPPLVMQNVIMAVEKPASAGQMDLPTDANSSYSNVTIVWLGTGTYPGNVPAGCTLTTDSSVLTNAIAVWKARHGVTDFNTVDMALMLAPTAAAPPASATTRFYLPASGTCPITPTPGGSWETTTGFGALPTDITKANTGAAAGTTRTSTVINVLEDRLDRVYVSSQQLAAQTIPAGTFSAATLCQEGSTNANAWWQVVIKVVSSDGSTVRGTLYAGSAATVPSATTGAENAEMPVAQSLSRIKNALATSSVTASTGDRIQIEVGARWQPTNTSQTFSFSYGDPTATSDLALTADSSTVGDPWVELSNSLIWAVGPATWSGTATAAGTGTATVTGFASHSPTIAPLTAAGAGAAAVTGQTTYFGVLTGVGVGAAAVPGFGFGITAAGSGTATVAGSVSDTDAPSAAGVGAASVSGRGTVFAGPVAAGQGGATVTPGAGGVTAISFVGAAAAQTINEATPSTTSIDSALPTGVTADDLILLAVHRSQDYALTGTPTGYTALDNVIDTGISPGAADTDIFYRIADGSETTTGPTFTTTSPARFITHAAVYRGVDKSAPFIAHAGQDTAGSSTTSRVAPAISNTDTRAWGVFATSVKNVVAPVSFTAPAGLADKLHSDIGSINTGTSTGNLAAEWADTGGQVGSTGSVTYTGTSSGAASVAIAWAAFLRPTAGDGVQLGVVVAAAAGHASVGGFATDVGLRVAAGTGAGAVAPAVVVVIASAGAGAASVALSGAVVIKSGVAQAAGVGAATVTAVRIQLGAVTAAGVGTATATGVPIHAPTIAPLTAVGVFAAAVVGQIGIVVPSHIAVQATVAFNGLSNVAVLAVPPGEVDLDDLGALPDVDVTFDGVSAATVLPVAPGTATVQTT